VSPPDCHITFSQDVYPPGVWWLELTSLQATKAAALASVRRQIGADTLISFGDNHNDLPMSRSLTTLSQSPTQPPR
jgi:hydroxymethylpyrimidine pyrophosphatase-like HAD family hydrolase